jgi:pilus assembly protein CpaD
MNPYRRHGYMIAVAFALLAGACTPTSNWSEVQAPPKQNTVESIRLVHDVRFTGGAQISASEMAQLDGFITRHDIGYGDRVYVLTDTSGAVPQRARNVLNYMKAHGIAANGLSSVEAQPGMVRVVVNRHVVVPPNCPDWSKPATADYGNTPMSNLGCSTTANLGAMVADPGELVQGRQPGAADAEGSTGSIRRYRADKIKPLKAISTGAQ